jgi:cell division protease FtsH
MIDAMCMAFGGRAAEEIVFGKISTGALADLERITKMAYSMVTIYGMNKEIGHMSFYDSKASDYSFQKPYSEATAERIDREVKGIITAAFERTRKLLIEHREHLDIVAQELLEKEIIFQSDLERLIGKRPFDHPTTYQRFTSSNNGKDDEKEPEKKPEEKSAAPVAETRTEPEESAEPPAAPRQAGNA